MASTPTLSAQGNQGSKQDLPKVRIGYSDEFVEKISTVTAHAMLPNPLWRYYFIEKNDEVSTSDLSDEEILEVYHAVVKKYLGSEAPPGTEIAETGDFSACAAWSPPGVHDPPKEYLKAFDELEPHEQTADAYEEYKFETVRKKQLTSKYGLDYWRLMMLARDPRKPKLPGAVRAVLQPLLNKAVAENKPIWLSTTNPHARDIYLHLGFRQEEEVSYGGRTSWALMLHPRP